MQCQNCSSNDQITIAGKVFCAHCGTPNNTMQAATSNTQTPANTQSPIPIQPSYGIDTPTEAVPSSATSHYLNQPQMTGSLSTLPSQVHAQPLVSQQAATPAVAPVAQPVPSQQVQATLPTQPTVPAPAPAAVPIVSTPVSPSPTTTLPRPIEQPTTNSLPSVTAQPNKIESSSTGELSALDLKNDSVFSDEQLHELAATKTNRVQQPATLFGAMQRPMSDIRPVNKPTQSTLPEQAHLQKSAIPTQPNVVKKPMSNTPPQVIDSNAHMNQASTLLRQVDKPATSSSKKESKTGSKVASVGLSLAGVALLGLYVWQINYPNLALKVAGSKAGISASLPSYMPNGWKISGDIQTNPGSIGYKLTTNGGDKSISVSQVRSDWDSQALAENYLSTNTRKYTALQSEGLTIYLYNDNQASWVNHGTWYKIEGDTKSLSQDQIIKMATSL